MPLTHRPIRLVVLLSVLAPAPARAADWLLTPFLGVKFSGSTSIVDLEQAASETMFTFGASVARIGSGIVGVEGDFAFVPGYFERSEPGLVARSYVFDVMGNLILTLPPSFTGGGLRPYVSLGAGLMHAEGVDLYAVFRIRRTMPAISLGGGATGFVTNRAGVRFDVRYLRSVAQEDEFIIRVGRQLNYWRGTMGIVLRY